MSDAIAECQRLAATEAPAPRIVALRDVGLGTGKTLGVSAATIVVLLSLWGLVSGMRLVAPLFLPTPSEVVTQFVAVFQDGYANATLAQHLSASLIRISLAAAIALASAGWARCYNVAEGFEGGLDETRKRGALGGWRAGGLPWTQS